MNKAPYKLQCRVPYSLLYNYIFIFNITTIYSVIPNASINTSSVTPNVFAAAVKSGGPSAGSPNASINASSVTPNFSAATAVSNACCPVPSVSTVASSPELSLFYM